MTESDKIIQIMPAESWVATYQDEDGEDQVSELVCFALVESEDEGKVYRSVRPMIWGEEGMIDFADEADTFTGLSHISSAE
ncbi:MAG: hypothetical protein AAB150_18400 [Pseudomonadota bacterium]